jgi:hypothetical protein
VSSNILLTTLLFIFIVGLADIEIKERRKINDEKRYFGEERRQVRKVPKLDEEPASSTAMSKMEELLQEDKIETRDGLRFIMSMMSELYIADFKRNLKINQVIEQLEILQNKTIIYWIEQNKKTAWLFTMLFIGLVVDEIRVPVFQAIFKWIGIPLP